MKKITRAAVAGIAALAIGAGTAPALAQTTALTEEDATTLQFMREEERMARELYQEFAEMYDGARPFSNVTTSEQCHFDAVGQLLERYEVEDPSAGLAPGTCAFPEVQELYDGWLAQGSASVEAAYQVGVDLETRDIADLQEAIDATGEESLDTAYAHLKAGSEKHLAAYQNAVDGNLGAGMGEGTGGRGQGRGAGIGAGTHGQGMGMNAGDGTGPRAQAGGCPVA